MTRKLTLSMDEDVIEKAKRLAAANNTSVSAMFARIVKGMDARKKGDIPIGPITRQALGIAKMPKGKSYRQVLTEALLEKYGIRK
jgi:hypothetical protein